MHNIDLAKKNKKLQYEDEGESRKYSGAVMF